jgi:phage tail tube protein FII
VVNPQSLQIQGLKNVEIRDTAGNLLGDASEINLPEPKRSFIEHKGLGMPSPIELPVGLEKRVAIFVGANIGTLGMLIHPPLLVCKCRLRDCVSNISINPSNDQEVSCEMAGNFSAGAPHSNQQQFSLHFLKLRVGGTEIELFDLLSNIWRKGGRDLI